MDVAKVINGTSKPKNVKVGLFKTHKKLILYTSNFSQII